MSTTRFDSLHETQVWFGRWPLLWSQTVEPPKINMSPKKGRDHFRRKLHHSTIDFFQDILVSLAGNESPFYSYTWFWCGFISWFPTKDQPDIGSELTISRQYEVWHIENCWNTLHWNSTDDTPDLERKTFEDPIAWFERLYLYSLVSELCLFQLLNFLARDDRGGKDCWTPKKIYRRWGFACFG